jgi:hypothetical protein
LLIVGGRPGTSTPVAALCTGGDPRSDSFGVAGVDNKGEFQMNIATKLSLASFLALSVATPVQAQSPKQGDYYAPTQTPSQQASPSQQQQTKEGDYYKPSQTTPQQSSPAQQQQTKEGDYYKPGGKE